MHHGPRGSTMAVPSLSAFHKRNRCGRPESEYLRRHGTAPRADRHILSCRVFVTGHEVLSATSLFNVLDLRNELSVV